VIILIASSSVSQVLETSFERVSLNLSKRVVFIVNCNSVVFVAVGFVFTLSYFDHFRVHTVSRKNAPSLYNLNSSLKTESISVVFGVQYPDEISHMKIINSPTSPE